MSTACRTLLGGEGGPPSPKLLPRRRRAGNHRAATSRGFAALPPPRDISGLIAWAVVGQEDRRGNLFPTKRREGKIDADVALLIAIGRAQASDDGAEDITAFLLNHVIG